MKANSKGISRREFAARAALGAVAVANPLPPAAIDALSASFSQQPPVNARKLSAQGEAEAEGRYRAILSQYGDRFSEAQKADLRRLCFVLQPQLDGLRAWPVANSDAPALYLKPLVEREKKGHAAPNLKSAPPSLKPEASAKPNAGEKR
jgi:hypothetical protein